MYFGWLALVNEGSTERPVVEAVLVVSRLADGFAGNRGGVGGLTHSRRLPHTYEHRQMNPHMCTHSRRLTNPLPMMHCMRLCLLLRYF